MDIGKFGIKKIILSKLNIKLTLLFIIVGLVAPSLAIYYFYTISLSAMTLSLSPEQAPLLKTAIVTIVVLIAVNAGVLGFFVSRSISKPIKELYKATRKVEKGNYNVRLDIKTNDEIYELAQAFNKTTASLGRLEEERKEIDSAKTEFLSITSHELRSPMTPMKAQLQMLEEGYFGALNKKQKESLGIVIRNADRLDNIIVDFLEVSRIEAARLKFNFKDTDMAQTVQDTVKFMEGFAKEKNIDLITNIDKLPIIEVDPDRVSQVLRNLINNAIKFSNDKSKIKINTELINEYILFSIRDYGCGLSSDNQIRVFEPFYQVENANRRRHGGTGLGLAICRGIVESQNGKIWVESQPGKGCKFNFTIPLKPVRNIKPIKILFSQKGVIERKIKEEFKTILGPLGLGEFNELKSKNSLGKEDLFEYVDSLTGMYIIP
ncbi:MAG: HAMP domain-containing histidine kinase, partial [Thermoplasmatales archaeon]|nr:HAMP domain-containing histidine kinase [Thermoplasmatales archaeon]